MDRDLRIGRRAFVGRLLGSGVGTAEQAGASVVNLSVRRPTARRGGSGFFFTTTAT